MSAYPELTSIRTIFTPVQHGVIQRGWIRCYLCCTVLLLSGFLHVLPAQAADLPVLTVDELRDRLEHPQAQNPAEIIDLQGFFIDLQDPDLRQTLISEVRSRFTRAHPERVLDISHAVIQGDWPIAALSNAVRLVPELLQNQLTPSEWQQLQDHPDVLSESQPQRFYRWQSSDFARSPTWQLLRLNLRAEHTQFQGAIDLSQTLVLQPWQAQGASFSGDLSATNSIWLALLDLSQSTFRQMPRFEQSRFWDTTTWQRSRFAQGATFAYSQFEQTPNFNQASFGGEANWRGSRWLAGANWSQSQWRDRTRWNDSQVQGVLDLSEAVFHQPIAFRNTQFAPGSSLDLRQATVLAQLDLSNSQFSPDAKLLADGLIFGSLETQVIGDRGRVGALIQLSQLTGSETTLANLVRNFRRLEQIADANRLEVLGARLWIRQQQQHLRNTPWYCWWQATGTVLVSGGVGLLLWLSEDGTSIRLVLLVGGLGMTLFALLFWAIDRGLRPQAEERRLMLGSSLGSVAIALWAIGQIAPHPLRTLLGLGLWLVPLPGWILLRYARARSSSEPTAAQNSYFWEDGSQRHLHLLIVRLPILPKFPFFRDRYSPILSDRRWGWLNYYDFSLNNLFKFGFNDLRLRDKAVPGWLTVLVWYEWALGIGYVALLLWTLARTIPGLNLLIYLS
ncbi:MAG: pentapeptide repeat-containing protein [Cyanobacteria bacterium P01_G01_bin.54]